MREEYPPSIRHGSIRAMPHSSIRAPERLSALHAYGIVNSAANNGTANNGAAKDIGHDVVSQRAEIAFDDMTRLAANLCDMPISMITMVGADHQWFTSTFGIELTDLTLDDGFCPMVVDQGQPFIVPDARAEPQHCANPMVTKRGISFYAGVPLITPVGHAIGAICVMDRVPRELTRSQINSLEALARQVITQLELRLSASTLEQKSHTLAAVSSGVAAQVGGDFFSALVRHFTQALGVDYAYISLHSKNSPGQMETLAVCHQGRAINNFKYDLSIAPCQDTLAQGRFCACDQNVQSVYPQAAHLLSPMAIESYAAMPIFDTLGRPFGVLAIMDTKPLTADPLIEQLLTIFSVRIATELERQRDEATQIALLASEQAARHQAEIANQMKDDFLAVISHELRSPLNPIVGWSSLLRRGTLAPGKVDIALETIERNAKLQVRLIDDLLDVSRLLRHNLVLTKAPVILEHVITAALTAIEPDATRKAIHIDESLDHSSLVVGDAVRLQQVVENLLANSVRFTPTGGQITLTLTHDDGYVTVMVADTGKGIEPDFLPYVFDRFRQEDYSTTRKFGGLGVGLTIVRQLVEMHGGSVSACSAGEGQGATFSITLPLADS